MCPDADQQHCGLGLADWCSAEHRALDWFCSIVKRSQPASSWHIQSTDAWDNVASSVYCTIHVRGIEAAWYSRRFRKLTAKPACFCSCVVSVSKTRLCYSKLCVAWCLEYDANGGEPVDCFHGIRRPAVCFRITSCERCSGRGIDFFTVFNYTSAFASGKSRG